MSAIHLIEVFVAAAIASMLLTKGIASAFGKLQLIDVPDGARKLQTSSVPLGGGLAVALAMVLVLAASYLLGWIDASGETYGFLAGLLPAAAVLLVVGVVDDFVGLTGIYKLIGQFLAATLLAVGGAHFESVSILGHPFALGDLAIPFAIFFTLGAINAFNLIDGSDAFASSVGAIVALTMGVICLHQGNAAAGVLSIGLSGALVGFLRYNAPPAKIYLGDTGSMLIGLVVAYVSIACSVKEQAVVAIAVPVALCALPILDAAAALLRRVLTGQSVFAADRGHLHHSLLLRGLTASQAAVVAVLLTAFTCGGALASYFTGQELWATLSVFGVFVALASFRVFGHNELGLVFHHFSRRFEGLTRRWKPKATDDRSHHSIQIQGSRGWKFLWQGLCERAAEYDIHYLRLNINIPYLHENFYATWEADDKPAREQGWAMVFPLTHGTMSVGKLHFRGGLSAGDTTAMREVMDLLDALQAEIAAVIEHEELLHAPAVVGKGDLANVP